MTDTSKCLRAYAVGDEDVTDGSVENYGFDWGDPVTTPDDRCGECTGNCGCGSCGCENRCGCCGCQNRCGCCSCGCQNWCDCDTSCGCETVPEPEPEPDPIETPPACTCARCRKTTTGNSTYPIVEL